MDVDFLSMIKNFDVISFDVFDTLLVRPYLGQGDLGRKVGKVRRGVYKPNYLMKSRQIT